MPKGDLETLLKKARREEPVPDFRRVWRQAEAMGSPEKHTPAPLRRVLVPVTAAAAIVLLAAYGILVALQSGGDEPVLTFRDGVRNPTESLAHLEDMETWDGNLDGLGTEWTFDVSSAVSSGDNAVDSSVMVISTNVPGDDIYQAQTDFLLDLEIPTWIQAVERNGR